MFVRSLRSTLFPYTTLFRSMNIKLTFVSIILFPVYGFAVKYFYSSLRSLTRDRSQALAEVQEHLHERVQGIPVTRSFATEDYEQNDLDVRNHKFITKAINQHEMHAKIF